MDNKTINLNHHQSEFSKKNTLCKLTTTDQDKKQSIMKKITANDIENLRILNIKDLDFNIFESVESLEFLDSQITPLIYCAYYGKSQIAKIILKNPLIDVDLQSKQNKHTPLIVACMGGNYQMVKVLLSYKAQVNKPNALHQTPLIVTIYRIMEEYNSFQNKRICFKIVEVLINHGADVNWIIDKQKGYTLLHFLSSSQMKMNKVQKQLNYDVIKYLLEKGANVELKAINQKKVQDLVKNHCNMTAILQLILKHKQLNRKLKQNIPKTKNNGDFKLKKKNKSMLRDLDEAINDKNYTEIQTVQKISMIPTFNKLSQSIPESRGQQKQSKWKILSIFSRKSK